MSTPISGRTDETKVPESAGAPAAATATGNTRVKRYPEPQVVLDAPAAYAKIMEALRPAVEGGMDSLEALLPAVDTVDDGSGVEEVPHTPMDGFIPHTNGGMEASVRFRSSDVLEECPRHGLSFPLKTAVATWEGQRDDQSLSCLQEDKAMWSKVCRFVGEKTSWKPEQWVEVLNSVYARGEETKRPDRAKALSEALADEFEAPQRNGPDDRLDLELTNAISAGPFLQVGVSGTGLAPGRGRDLGSVEAPPFLFAKQEKSLPQERREGRMSTAFVYAPDNYKNKSPENHFKEDGVGCWEIQVFGRVGYGSISFIQHAEQDEFFGPEASIAVNPAKDSVEEIQAKVQQVLQDNLDWMAGKPAAKFSEHGLDVSVAFHAGTTSRVPSEDGPFLKRVVAPSSWCLQWQSGQMPAPAFEYHQEKTEALADFARRTTQSVNAPKATTVLAQVLAVKSGDKEVLTLSRGDRAVTFVLYYDEQEARGDSGARVPGFVSGEYEVWTTPTPEDLGTYQEVIRQHVSPGQPGGLPQQHAAEQCARAMQDYLLRLTRSGME